MRFIGDVHGKWNKYKSIAETAEKSIQVGDFGIGFGEDSTQTKFIDDFMADGNHRFIRGNHDNLDVCAERPGFIADAVVEDDMMFVGGGLSIDKEFRTANVNWWENEELSYSEMKNAISVYDHAKPRIMVTHDAPEDIIRLMVKSYRRDYHSLTRQGFAAMFRVHQPEYWIFGHWHRSMKFEYGDTTFICLNELEFMDIDL
jgi:hypothetical protein